MGMGMFNNFGWGVSWFSPLFFLLLIGGIVFLIFYRLSNGKKEVAGLPNTSLHYLDILNERYAKGEIDDNEYEHRKTLLTRQQSQ